MHCSADDETHLMDSSIKKTGTRFACTTDVTHNNLVQHTQTAVAVLGLGRVAACPLGRPAYALKIIEAYH